MSGGLGPLQELGIGGSMTWLLEPAGRETRLILNYNVGGYKQSGLEEWARPVDSVLSGQLQRLKKFMETGAPN